MSCDILNIDCECVLIQTGKDESIGALVEEKSLPEEPQTAAAKTPPLGKKEDEGVAPSSEAKEKE